MRPARPPIGARRKLLLLLLLRLLRAHRTGGAKLLSVLHEPEVVLLPRHLLALGLRPPQPPRRRERALRPTRSEVYPTAG